MARRAQARAHRGRPPPCQGVPAPRGRRGEGVARPRDNYFTLPREFFVDAWFERLSLPATAVLLIGLQTRMEDGWWRLPTERGPEWFGMSAKTLQRGLGDLLHADVNLLESRLVRVKDARARYGVTQVNEYRFREPFGDAADGDLS